MRLQNLCELKKHASKAFIVLFTVNQLIVLHLIWKSYLSYEPSTSEKALMVNSEINVTEFVLNATELQMTTSTKEPFSTAKTLVTTSTELPLTTSTKLSLPTTTTVLPKTTPRYTMIYDENSKNDSKIYVLFYNGCFGLPFWSLGKETLAEDDLKAANCPHTNCVLTHKHDLLKNIHDYNAVIFNVWYPGNTLPLTRSPRQHYIMAANE